jgi:hypothetical protein
VDHSLISAQVPEEPAARFAEMGFRAMWLDEYPQGSPLWVKRAAETGAETGASAEKARRRHGGQADTFGPSYNIYAYYQLGEI